VHMEIQPYKANSRTGKLGRTDFSIFTVSRGLP
jgi:hypothetical protein